MSGIAGLKDPERQNGHLLEVGMLANICFGNCVNVHPMASQHV